MQYSNRKSLIVAASLAAVLTVAGCHKKNPAPPPPPAPPATAPTPMATITAEPSTIAPGGSSVLTWKTSDATNVSIVGLGQVASSGTQTVQPSQTTSYHLIAQGVPNVGRRALYVGSVPHHNLYTASAPRQVFQKRDASALFR